MNDKSQTLNLEKFKDMLQICLRLPGQKFEDALLEEEFLSFIRDLGHTGEIKVLTDVNVNHMHQPWRSFAAIINRHQDTQIYGAFLLDELTNQDMKDSEAYKQYFDVASGAEPPKAKIKYKKKADKPVTRSKSKTAPASKGSGLKSPSKVAKSGKKKIPA
ncbi:hypothetical protein Tco_1049676 [Tanacetum coccineum]